MVFCILLTHTRLYYQARYCYYPLEQYLSLLVGQREHFLPCVAPCNPPSLSAVSGAIAPSSLMTTPVLFIIPRDRTRRVIMHSFTFFCPSVLSYSKRYQIHNALISNEIKLDSLLGDTI